MTRITTLSAHFRDRSKTYSCELICLNCGSRETITLPHGTPHNGSGTCSHCGCAAIVRPRRDLVQGWRRYR
ncbi:hypothetical protein [Microcystis phage Mae-JY09]